MSGFFTSETLSFLHHLGSLFDGECVDVHRVWVSLFSLELPVFLWLILRVISWGSVEDALHLPIVVD